MSDKPISPLRQRMIDDMTARRFARRHPEGLRPARQDLSRPFSAGRRIPLRARTFAAINCIWRSNRSAQGPSTPPSPRCGFSST